MTDQEANPQIEELLQQGISAARAGDHAAARPLLEQVVEMDQQNEKGWFWLAAVVDTVEEKRVCLGNVLVINPNNHKAQRLLDQLSSAASESPEDPLRGSAGVGRKPVYLAIGLGIAAIITLLIVAALVLGGGSKDEDKQASTQEMTEASASQPSDSRTPTPAPAVAQATEDTTDTPGQAGLELPATWTPVPSSTPRSTGPIPTFPPPSARLSGQIILRSGQSVGDPNNQPIVVINPDGSNPRLVTPYNERGHAPVFSPDGSVYAFIKISGATREPLLQTNNLSGTNPVWVSTRWGGMTIVTRQDAPAWSPNGTWLAFTGIGPGARVPDLYMVLMTGPEGNPDALVRLTQDEASESWPAWSPDSGTIVYAAAYTELNGQVVTELYLFTLADSGIRPLTSNGAKLTESAPDWSPDGRFIVFAGREEDSPQTDIYRIAATGSQPAEKLIDSGGQDIQPRYSPDGRYVVFSSDRAGNWDVYIYDITADTIYQVTSGSQVEIANDWGS